MSLKDSELCTRKCADCTKHWFLNVTMIAGSKEIIHYCSNQKTAVIVVKNTLDKLFKRIEGVK